MKNRFGWVVAACVTAATLITAGCNRGAAGNVAATVNGRPITYPELERAMKTRFVANPEDATSDQTEMQRLDVMRTLIDNEILLQRAEKMSLMATDSEVDARITELKAPYTKEEFDKQLKSRNITFDELRTQVKRDLSLSKLINKEITSKINITDADVKSFYAANKNSFSFPEPQLRLAQIVVTPGPDPAVRNLKNDKAQNDQQAEQKIRLIEAQLKQGADFATMAQNFSEDPATAANGGDLGYLGESAFEKTNPELRKMVLSLNAGEISPIIKNQDGYRILKMISKEPAGQRELSDPRVQQNIREALLNRKDQLLKAAYYEIARNESKVQNYVAQRVLEAAAKK